MCSWYRREDFRLIRSSAYKSILEVYKKMILDKKIQAENEERNQQEIVRPNIANVVSLNVFLKDARYNKVNKEPAQSIQQGLSIFVYK